MLQNQRISPGVTPLLLPTMNEEPRLVANPSQAPGGSGWPPPREYASAPNATPPMFIGDPPDPLDGFAGPVNLSQLAPLPLPTLATSGDGAAAQGGEPVPVTNAAGRLTPLPLPSMNP